jgi:hypothetical protein
MGSMSPHPYKVCFARKTSVLYKCLTVPDRVLNSTFLRYIINIARFINEIEYRVYEIKSSLIYMSIQQYSTFWRPELNINSVNQLIFVMVKCGVLFEVRTEFLNNI